VADGVTVDGGDAGGALELRLMGLTPGRHRIVAFLNVTDGKPDDRRARTQVSIAGGSAMSVVPSFRALADEVAQTVALEFDARSRAPKRSSISNPTPLTPQPPCAMSC